MSEAYDHFMHNLEEDEQMAKKFYLQCPVLKPDNDPCEADILVWAEPRHRGGWDEPPTEAHITDVRAKECDHDEDLGTGSYDSLLMEQISEQEDESHMYDHERDWE